MKKVYGIKKIDYVSKKTGKRVLGTELHCLYEDRYVEGFACEVIYVRTDLVPINLAVGSEIEVYYDKDGKVIAVNVLKD